MTVSEDKDLNLKSSNIYLLSTKAEFCKLPHLCVNTNSFISYYKMGLYQTAEELYPIMLLF